jgi:ABC-2 type transport system permease protein
MIPFNTLLKREIKRFMKISKETLLTPLITSMLYLLIFGVGLGEQIKEGQNVPYFVFLIPGLITMGMLNNSFMNPSFSLLLSKVYGDIEDLKITPLTPKVILWSMSVAGLIRGLVVSVIIFIAGQIFNLLILKQFLLPAHPLILIFVLLIAGITFALIGFSAGIFVRSFEKLNIIAQFVILPLTYLGGVFFSLNNLHPFWQLCSKFNPIFYYINAARYSFLNISDASFFSTSLITILFFIIAYSVALLSAKKASYKHL